MSTDEEVRQKWADFKVKFKREFADVEEEKKRLDIFLNNLKYIEEHNQKFDQGLVTFKMGINHFSDRTPEEKKRMC